MDIKEMMESMDERKVMAVSEEKRYPPLPPR
jgi:hypothetical protein